MGPDVKTLEDLREALRAFAKERDWGQYHSPKNLAMALSAEVGELLEVFQWLTEEESRSLTPEARAAATGEIADVLIYLVQLSTQLDIDPLAAARDKMKVNAKKYPADASRVSLGKNTER